MPSGIGMDCNLDDRVSSSAKTIIYFRPPLRSVKHWAARSKVFCLAPPNMSQFNYPWVAVWQALNSK